MDFGDWKGSPSEISPGDIAMAGAVGYMARRYSSPSRGVSLSVLLLCGLPGDIGTHTPDACYPGAGYSLSSSSLFEHYSGRDKQPAFFRTAMATREGPNPSTLRILWAWNASKGWSAPDEARWKFASAPSLCKLYVVREIAGAVVDPKDDPCNNFLSVLLPELDRVVFSPHDR
jgi:hypothetical protein